MLEEASDRLSELQAKEALGAGRIFKADLPPSLPLNPDEWLCLVAPVSVSLNFKDDEKWWLVAVSGESIVWAKRRLTPSPSQAK